MSGMDGDAKTMNDLEKRGINKWRSCDIQFSYRNHSHNSMPLLPSGRMTSRAECESGMSVSDSQTRDGADVGLDRAGHRVGNGGGDGGVESL